MAETREIITRVPGWTHDEVTDIERVPGGYTNENYYLTYRNQRYVLRVSGVNTADLGIHRDAEAEIYRAVSDAGIAPPLEVYIEPEGHLVTRFVEGGPWEFDDFKKPDVQALVVGIMKRAHKIQGVAHRFDPVSDIYSRIKTCNHNSISLPPELDAFVDRLERANDRLQEDVGMRTGLCHNDPFPNNFLHNGKAWLLDWEFGGMGDTMWDLACLTMGSDDEGKERFLKLYYGSSDDTLFSLLEDSRYIVRFWNAMWALLQTFLSPIDHDFADWAERIFSSMSQSMEES